MLKSPTADPALAAEHDYAPAAVFSIKVGRNRLMQGLAVGMAALTGVTILPWPLVLAWAAATIAISAGGDHAQRVAVGGGRFATVARSWLPVLRLLTSGAFALAVFALFLRGGPNERLVAYALMTASMVFVLMRYYRSPVIFLVSLAPYAAVLLAVGVALARQAWAGGDYLGAVCAAFPLVMFGTLFWSARGQLAKTWSALRSAREAAEDREQAADAANRAKSNFLATMSHELRTPLNGVLGMAQAMTGERLSDTQRHRVKIIRRSSESLLAVLNDLLDLSKIETHSLDLEIAEFDLEHLARGVVAAYEPLANRKGLAFAFEVSDAARGRYLGDSARIRRILYSLADNAVKFTDSGGVTLSVQREGEELVFRIDDSGIGIAGADLGHLFDGFYQADSSRSRRHGGAGLGLAVCRDLSTLMGGSVEAVSEFGAGSTFIVRLPLPPAPAQAAARPAAAPSAPAQDRRPELRVLAAEDNETNQLVLKTLLEQAGMDVTLVDNGRQSLEAWETQVWDLILMDIQMPVMDGVDAARAIRAREAETGRPRTPILAVTANAMTHQVAEYTAAGMDGMVPKPLDITVLIAAMQAALEPPAADAGQSSAVA